MKMNKAQLKEFVIKTLKENESLINDSAEKWESDSVKHPGSLRRHFGLKKDEKLTSTLINKEIQKLKSKDKDVDKPGIQGLTVGDRRLLKKLNLAKIFDKQRKKKTK